MEKQRKSTHLYQIDLLRILAVFYVLILHTLGHGGVVKPSMRGSHQYAVSCAMEIWAYCAVNIFALISGYVGFRGQDAQPDLRFGSRFKKYLRLWLEVAFYAIVPSLVIFIFLPGTVSVRDILAACFPVTTGQYWYFSAYTGLFLLTPVLNAALNALDTAYLKRLVVIIVLVFSAYGSAMSRFSLGSGYSVIWLVLLYLCGGAVRKIRLQREQAGAIEKQGSGKICLFCFAGIAVCWAAAFAWLMMDGHFSFFDNTVERTAMMSYTAFTVTAAALLHLILFANLRIKKPAGKESLLGLLLRAGGKSSFAVYLLNTQPAIWKLTADKFLFLSTAHTYTIVTVTLGFALVFLIAATAADQARRAVCALFMRFTAGSLPSPPSASSR